MKTLGRIVIILAAFFILSGVMIWAVNSSGASAASADFDGAPPQFRDAEEGGEHAEGGEFRPERGEGGGSRWMFGLIKNVGVMAILVTLIALPKSISKKKKRQAAVGAGR